MAKKAFFILVSYSRRSGELHAKFKFLKKISSSFSPFNFLNSNQARVTMHGLPRIIRYSHGVNITTNQYIMEIKNE